MTPTNTDTPVAWRVVPSEPTEAMMRAMYENRFPPNSAPAGGFSRWATWDEARAVEIEPLTKAYAAMLEALPAEPGPPLGTAEASRVPALAKILRREMQNNSIPLRERSEAAVRAMLSAAPAHEGLRDGIAEVRTDVLALCKGHPHAKIAWPHRELHAIAERLSALIGEQK